MADDYRTAKVFENHGIDFCCGGKVSLEAACTEKRDRSCYHDKGAGAVMSEPVERNHNYASWELPFLVDYIINVHHTYVKENTGQLAGLCPQDRRCPWRSPSGGDQDCLHLDTVAADLAAHLREEEEVFFPAIKRADAARKEGSAPEVKDIETIRNSIKKLTHEHEEVGDAIHTIRFLCEGLCDTGESATPSWSPTRNSRIRGRPAQACTPREQHTLLRRHCCSKRRWTRKRETAEKGVRVMIKLGTIGSAAWRDVGGRDFGFWGGHALAHCDTTSGPIIPEAKVAWKRATQPPSLSGSGRKNGRRLGLPLQRQ